MVAPQVVQAAAAVTSPAAPYDGGGYDGGGYDDGDGYDESEGYGADADQDEDSIEGLGHIDYERALAGLGDWQSELKKFGVTAGKSVASQALTTIAGKLGPKATAVPAAPPPMSMATKVAIGAAVALPLGYLLLRRRPAAA